MQNSLRIAQARLTFDDPHNCTDMKDLLTVFTALFDGLVNYDFHMGYVPALAESWVVSPDARTWTFRLREGVKFHNGKACDAEAVKYSLERMARPDMGVTLGAPGVYHQYLAGMQLETPDRHTVRLTLAQPMADLLDVLVTGYILPPDPGNKPKDNPIGTGPYKFMEHIAGEKILVEANPDYFLATPANESVEWQLVPDPGQRIEMVSSGQAHIAATLPPEAVADAPGLELVRSRGTTSYILLFTANQGPLQDPRVRLALNLGVDRQAIINQVMQGAAYPLTGFVSPYHFGADPDERPFEHDPAKARELLQQAGYGGGLSLTLDSPTSLPNEAEHLSRIVAAQLSEIGVDVKIVLTEDRELYANKVRQKDIHDLCVFDSSPLSTYRVLKEKIDSRFAGSWWQGYANQELESLLDRAQGTVDDRQREAIYRQCFKILNQDPPWLYFYNYQAITAVGPQMAGWELPWHGVIDPRLLPGV